jgi:hypothetical protein
MAFTTLALMLPIGFQNCQAPISFAKPEQTIASTNGTEFKWTTSPWGECSVECGSGTQTRSVQCLNEGSQENVSGDEQCGEAKPALTQVCVQPVTCDEIHLIKMNDPPVQEWVAQGQTIRLQDATKFVITGSERSLRIYYADFGATNNNWYLNFGTPDGQTLAAGAHFNAIRFSNSTQAQLDIYGQGRGCNEVTGTFDIREYILNEDGTVASVAIDFSQSCEGTGLPLKGSVRIRSSISTP